MVEKLSHLLEVTRALEEHKGQVSLQGVFLRDDQCRAQTLWRGHRCAESLWEVQGKG